jgi:hypothetical protein
MTRQRTRTTPSPGERAASTTLDVVLCCLLVSAAVGVLAAASPPADGHDPRTADHAAELLATTTVAVDQPVPSPTPGRDAREDDASTVHGTLAALLARAAVADATRNSGVAATTTLEPATDHGPGGNGGSGVARVDAGDQGQGAFAAAVAARTRGSLSSVDAAVNVTASYAPLPGSDPRGRVAVGPAVPGDVDVAVARFRVPVGAGPAPAALERAAREDGDRGLARTVADAAVETVLPSSRTRWALRDDATRLTVADRYRRVGRSLSVSPTGALDAGRVRRANALIVRALADEYRAAIRTNYHTPTAAAGAARPRVVVFTVRTWSP